MQAEIEIQVLHPGTIEQSQYGPYRQLQCFDGDTVFNHRVRGETEEELQHYKAGVYLATLQARAGNYGRGEWQLNKLVPKQPSK